MDFGLILAFFVITIIATIMFFMLSEKAKSDKFLFYLLLPLILIPSFLVAWYLMSFGFDPNNRNFTTWNNVAAFFNSSLSPLLLLASIALLYKTWDTSKQELAETKQEFRLQNKIARYPLEIDVLRNRLKVLTENLYSQCSTELLKKSLETTDFILMNETPETRDETIRLVKSGPEYELSCGNDLINYCSTVRKKFPLSKGALFVQQQSEIGSCMPLLNKNQDFSEYLLSVSSFCLRNLVTDMNRALYDEIHVLDQYKQIVQSIVDERDIDLQKMLKKEVNYFLKPVFENALNVYLMLDSQNSELVAIYRNLHRN
ncbi:hypothetical protein [Pseudoalteromonas byunsanensis]|uniref:Uncharacterized protein n=1 Tax=Pseudoalteromonas byunsanensis TaxID=327939 RepID=A0A1S1N557_9GAMM|nr:hypothetical protein [Pseudoalteromonas byunsanensis]OHU94497.1 hypothetical protein BIW53_15620 [Pseudoalteromonas byunsanensis]